MEKKGKVKYTPLRDKTISKELKKDKPISSVAEAQEDIEENLPKSTRKEEGSEKSLSRIQDNLEKGDISPKEAQAKAGIDSDKRVQPLTPMILRTIPKELKKPKVEKEKVKKPEKFKKITLEDGHTYHTTEKDTVCSNCLLPKNKTTTQCFKREMSRVGLRKFNDGLIDYVKGAFILLNKEEG